MRTLLIIRQLPWPLDKSGGGQRNSLLWEAPRRLGEVCVVVATPRTAISSSQVQEAGGEETRTDGLQRIHYEPGREAGMFRVLQVVLRGDLRRVAKNLAICNADFSLPDEDCSKQLRTIVRDFQPDLLVCRYLRCAVATGAAFLSRIPVVLDFDDIDWRVYASHGEQIATGGIAELLHHKFYGWYLERNGRRSLRHFAHVWVASEEDKQVLGNRTCSVLPNVPVLPSREGRRSPETKGQEPTILFVGVLTHNPNREGLERFLDRVWPRVRDAEPEVKLRVVGTLPDDGGRWETRWRQVANVEILGHVEDLSLEYERALFTIAPVYWGGGTKIKVLESLGRAKTCVVTPHALYGVGAYIRHGDSVLCAASDAECVEACLKLVRSECLRQNLATRGEEVIREHFSVTRFNDAVEQVVARFAGKQQNVRA